MGREIRVALPEGEPVFGVTSVENHLYVLRGMKLVEQVEVYDVDSSGLLHCLTVPGLTCGREMAACEYNRCAYISDPSLQSIYRVELPGPEAVVTRWPTHDKPWHLSISVRHGVLVTCRIVRKIKEFSTDGQLLQTVDLSQDVLSAWHAIQLCSGEYIMCHGYGPFGDRLQRVCLIGSDGQVVKSYGGLQGSGSQRMNTPVHLAVDRNGFVFVLDAVNRRVLLLSPELTYIRDVVTGNQLKWDPLRIHLDADRERLYVAVVKYEDGKATAGRVIVVTV